MGPSITLEQAIRQSTEEFVWRAVLQDGSVTLEQPGYSSDHLPAKEVMSVEYLPTKRPGFPEISCAIDLSKGERFVRYWTSLWRNGGGTQRLYVLGSEHNGQHALLAFYPRSRKISFAHTRPFNPSWESKPFALLPPDTVIRGGEGTNFIEWVYNGFGSRIEITKERLSMRAIYE